MGQNLRWTPAELAAYQRREMLKAAKATGQPVPDGYAKLSATTIRKKSLEEKLNKTEREFLRILRADHGIVRIQPITLVLGDDCRYTPDFETVEEVENPESTDPRTDHRITLWEVKGPFIREDARVKLLAAARTYREFVWKLAQRAKGGEWTITEVK